MGKNRFSSIGTVLLAVVVATATAFPVHGLAVAQPASAALSTDSASTGNASGDAVAAGSGAAADSAGESSDAAEGVEESTGTDGSSFANGSTGDAPAVQDAQDAVAATALAAEVAAAGDEAEIASDTLPEGSRTLADGVYTIASAAAPSEVLDVEAGSTAPGANVTLWSSYQAARQRWQVAYLGDGFYSLRAVHSGQALDVVASGKDPRTNVTQWTWCNTENQQWVIQDAGDGSYRVISRCNGLSLSAAGPSDGSNVRVDSYSGDASQRWVFTSILENGSLSVADGVYEISSAADSSKVLDVVAGSTAPGANVTLWSCYQAARQRWEVTYLGNGCYSLRAFHSDQALDVVASGKEEGANVTQWPWCNTDNQQWIIEDAGDGTYRIASRTSALSLCAAGSSDGSNVYTDSYTGAANQRWTFAPAVPEGSRTLMNGIYEISSAADSSEVLDVVAGSTAPGANVTLWNCYHDARQRWRVSYLGDGFYSLCAVHSGQALDVVASGKDPGANVTQWTSCRTENQQWVIQDAGGGTYRLVSRCNGLSLTAAGSSDGSNVYVSGYSAAANQRWEFTEMPPIEDGTYSICCASNTDQRLDVVAGSQSEGANVTLWSDDGCAWQRFNIENVEGLWYKITAVHSGQALDVVASGKSPGTNVTQWGYYGGDNQLWRVITHDDGSISFVSKCNGLALDVAGDSIVSGSNVNVGTQSPDDIGQHFVLQKARTTTVKNYSFTLSELENWQHSSKYATYSHEEGMSVLNPSTYSDSDPQYYRFADLRGTTGMTAAELNNYIASTPAGRSGLLNGRGQAVLDAAKRYNINEAYLLAHAILESGWGTSQLASGTYYDGNGFWEGDTWVEFSGYVPGTYYNFFGIGAYDDSAFRSGVKMAIANGWNSPEAALAGGAQWISSNYIYASSYPQETLYEMRWDIDRSENDRARGWHQYATSITWETSIATLMSNCYSYAPSAALSVSYIVPKYQG